MLTELKNGTDAGKLIKQHKRQHDRWSAWVSICNHYNGRVEGDKRITVARSDISVVHYFNEPIFSFDQYFTKLQKLFQTLEEYNQPKFEAKKG